VSEPGGAPASIAAMRCYRHPDRETYVSCVRCGRPICPSCMRPASVGFQCPEEVGAAPARNFVGARLQQGRPVVTYTLIGICVAVFLATFAGGGEKNDTTTLFLRLYLAPTGISHGQYYRLFTAIFLHFDWIHIGLNMYCLYIVGPPLEAALGRWRYLTLFLVSGLAGSAASFWLGPVLEGGAGASGAIFGLFGAYYFLARRLRMPLGPIVITIVLNLVLSFSIAGIDYHDHIGGLVTGGAVGAAFVFAPRPNRTLVQVGAVAAALVVVAAVVLLRVHQLAGYPNLAGPGL
jgi:membrane associated rhomboid family serine protease